MQQILLDPYQKTSGNTVESIVNHSARLSAREHLAIYQRSYSARLRDCMTQQFGALEYALGKDLFRAFADDYLDLHPSHNYNLSVLGKNFASHLEATRPDAGEFEKESWIDFMIQLARFEYAVGLIFEERADENYQLAALGDSEEKLKLVPVCHLFKFRFPVQRYFTAFKNGDNPDLPNEKESYCVVLRHNFQLAIYDLYKEQFELLSYLENSLNLSTAKAEFKRKNYVDSNKFDQTFDVWKTHWIEAKFFRV